MIRIAVLQRGWVVVGRVAEESDKELRFESASVIRRWGTTKGLGEIAINGPTSETILDACGSVRAHPLAVVMQIDCQEEKWDGRI
jgi:hypothetical protein